ncbi:MAG TPA: ABC transporter permease [Candidatus Aminicenantes bacterium]|nr:ABC transporter permease [Candidatus Aminicenantes bacterium]HOS11470.1 ABC transporter permease [Candidatus Aminicenantes bacterium]HPL13075.1 ABC transporter permease [Candidatus Aminicenantes bacterium]HQH45208.1 ABC transporter permease [Candidatus Aminicenantes bacterium]HQJ43386.1 ABC transporter permease [Candidatus Aminicenantes bacterium]
MKNFRSRGQEFFLTLPSFFWLSLFFLIPTALVFILAFRPADPFGGIGRGWTTATIKGLADPQYLVIAWRTLWVSFLSTAFCLLLAVPTAYAVARAPERRRNLLLMLVIVPFWTSFLIRVFAWKSILHPEGLIKKALVFCGLVDPSSQLLYNLGAVILVTVYTFLPFAILPIYAAAEKFDYRLLEAARDLGARPFQAFRKVFLPGIRQALVTAVLVVFIPSLGSYIVPDIVGGPGSEMLGNKIAQRVFVDRNLPLAGGLSIVLILAVLAPLLGVLALQGKKARIQPPEGGGKP